MFKMFEKSCSDCRLEPPLLGRSANELFVNSPLPSPKYRFPLSTPPHPLTIYVWMKKTSSLFIYIYICTEGMLLQRKMLLTTWWGRKRMHKPTLIAPSPLPREILPYSPPSLLYTLKSFKSPPHSPCLYYSSLSSIKQVIKV